MGIVKRSIREMQRSGLPDKTRGHQMSYLDTYVPSSSVIFYCIILELCCRSNEHGEPHPKEYNGYKVYDEYGCQLVPWQAEKVIVYVDAVDDYKSINFNGNWDLIEMTDPDCDRVGIAVKSSTGDFVLMTGNQVGALLMDYILFTAKDAVVSSFLICEMAAKAEGKTLIDKIEKIYVEYGYYHDALDSFTLKSKDGLERIQGMVAELRSSDSSFSNTASVIDYKADVDAALFGLLLKSNVLKCTLEDGFWIAVWSSGTEPKIKIYYSVVGADKNVTEVALKNYRNMITNRLGLA